MAKIGAIDFANNVERNRKALRQHCLENGKQVLEGETLDNIVAINNEIKTGTVEGQLKVEFKDLDGNYFAPTQYVNYGESATLPDGYPKLDPDLLEFDYWATSGGDSLDNVQRDILCLPQYKTKYDEATGQRPTYLICYFDETRLSPILQIGSIRTNTFVDWGDGGTAQRFTENTMTHTYEKAGLYTIKIYGDSYSLGNASVGVFSPSEYGNALLKAYIGENIVATSRMLYRSFSLNKVVLHKNCMTSNILQSCNSIKSVVIPNGATKIDTYCFGTCVSLLNVVIPSSVTIMESSAFASCTSLVNITIPNNVMSIGTSCFSDCSSLKDVVLPNTISTIENQLFYKNYNLRSIIIPTSVSRIISGAFQACFALSRIVLPNSIKHIDTSVFNTTYSLANIVLGSDFDCEFQANYAPLSDECLIDIANKLKDNTGLTAKTLSFSLAQCKSRMKTIMLNEFGERVPYGTAGAVSVLEFIQNKNWTVAFSNVL